MKFLFDLIFLDNSLIIGYIVFCILSLNALLDQDIAEPQAPEILPPVVVEEESSDLDGAPLPYDDSMDGESLAEGNSDLDGMPLKDGGMDLDGMPLGVVEDYDGAPSK